jgi:hypothetical protein
VPFQGKHVLWMPQRSIRGYRGQQCEKTPWWRRWGGAPSMEFEMRLCSSMAHSLRENGRCNRSPLLMFHVVQEGVGFDRLQTLFYYLKLPPLHIIPCWPDCHPCYRPEWPPLCGRVWGCCKQGLCASCPPCSHESNSNYLKMG